MIKKYGSREAYQAEVTKWAVKGGKSSTGGFRNMTPEERSEAGRKGGSVPRNKEV